MRFAVRGAQVLTMRPELGEGPLGLVAGGTVVVEDGRIAAVGSEETPIPYGTPVITAHGQALLPGMINLHQHAGMSLLRGWADDMPLMPWLETKIWPAEARLSADDVYWGTLLSLAEMLQSGTTCYADMYFHMDRVAEAVALAGLRGHLATGLLSVDGRGEHRLADAVAVHRTWEGAEDGRIHVWLGPHAPYTCPPDYMRQVLEAAERTGAPIHIHLHETVEEIERSLKAFGSTPIQHLATLGLFEHRVLAAHCVHLNADDLAILSGMRGGVAHDPRSNLKLGSGIAPLAHMLQRGVPVGLGTDGPASANAVGLWEEMRLAAWLQKNASGDPSLLPATTVLRLATRAGAEILGQPELGQIAPGAPADLVLVGLTGAAQWPVHDVAATLVYSTHDRDVDKVWVAGRLVVDGGVCTTIDLERVRAEVAARCQRLVTGL